MPIEPIRTLITYIPLGDGALIAEFGSHTEKVNPDLNRQIREVCFLLEKNLPDSIREYVPAFTSITFYYDFQTYDIEDVIAQVNELVRDSADFTDTATRCRTIPVWYGGEAGPDLTLVAEHNRLAISDVIAMHTQPEYLVYMMGFAPGFPYLGGMDPRIATPRKAVPRTKVVAGSVGIAGHQTGVYPVETPGGWQIIGRTPLELFDVRRADPAFLKTGDRVRFRSITKAEFEEIKSRSDRPCSGNVSEGAGVSASGIEVLKPGLLTTIQDLGRPGYQQSGMSVSGAMDSLAVRIGNILLGNPETDAALECTMTGPQLRFHSARWVVLTGGDLSPQVNGLSVAMWRRILISAGSLLSFGKAIAGCRLYICVSGGWDVPKVLSSRSTYLVGGVGGWQGRALRAGDRIPFSSAQDPGALGSAVNRTPDASFASLYRTSLFGARRNWWLAPGLYPAPSRYGTYTLRIVKGPEFDWLSEESQHVLLKNYFTVGTESNRMGYRLEGSMLSLQHPREMLSSAVTFGTIQLPAGGQPIVLMADRQTTGGYPRIAQIIHVDHVILSQLKPGDQVLFEVISLRDAQRQHRQREKQLSRLRQAILLRTMGS